MNAVLAFFQLLPAIIAAMKAVEDAIPGQSAGEQKLAAVRQMLEIVNGTFTPETWSKVQAVIAVLVNLFNQTGVFIKKQ